MLSSGSVSVETASRRALCPSGVEEIDGNGRATLDRPARPATAPALPTDRAPTVLVVDDDEDILVMVGEFLRAKGYNVVDATGGPRALEVCEREKVDLLLTDVVMPGMRGPELVQRLALSHPAMRVVYMSAYPPDLIRNRDARTPFLRKPFRLESLNTMIREILGMD